MNKNTGKIAQKHGFEAKIVEKKKEGEKRALKKIALQAKKEKRGRTQKKKRQAKKRADFGALLSIEPRGEITLCAEISSVPFI